MFCRNCGAQIKENVKFCPACGKPIGVNAEKDYPMTNRNIGKKKVVSIPILIVLILIVILGVLFLTNKKKEKEYQDLITSADTYLENKDYEQAIVYYLKAIDIDDDKAETYVKLGLAYREAGQMEEAVKCYENAIAQNPSIDDAYLGLADVYITCSNEEELESLFAEAVEQGENKSQFEKLQNIYSDMQRYQAYDRYLSEQYNMERGCAIGDGSVRSVGLCFAKLLDYDGNGFDDLAVCYTESVYDTNNIPYTINDYVLKVYSYENGNVEEIYSGEPAVVNGSDREIILESEGDGWNFATTENDNAEVYVLNGAYSLDEGRDRKIAYNALNEMEAKLSHNASAARWALKENSGLNYSVSDDEGIVQKGSYSYESDDLNMYACVYEDDEGYQLLMSYYHLGDTYFSDKQTVQFRYDDEQHIYVPTDNYEAQGYALSLEQSEKGIMLALKCQNEDDILQAELIREERYDIASD